MHSPGGWFDNQYRQVDAQYLHNALSFRKHGDKGVPEVRIAAANERDINIPNDWSEQLFCASRTCLISW
jgi:hypothetical protein